MVPASVTVVPDVGVTGGHAVAGRQRRPSVTSTVIVQLAVGQVRLAVVIGVELQPRRRADVPCSPGVSGCGHARRTSTTMPGRIVGEQVELPSCSSGVGGRGEDRRGRGEHGGRRSGPCMRFIASLHASHLPVPIKPPQPQKSRSVSVDDDSVLVLGDGPAPVPARRRCAAASPASRPVPGPVACSA